MPDESSAEVLAARDQVKRLNTEKEAIVRRRDRDAARLTIIDAQLAALTPLAGPSPSPAP